MRSTVRVITLFTLLAVLIPTLLAQDKEKDKVKGEKKENLAGLPKISGKLANPGTDKGKLVVSVPYSYPQRSGKIVHMKEGYKPVDLTPADDMIVRRLDPPIYYDNGKPRKPTAKELKEAKGEGNLPGYQAELSDLKRDQLVTCYCVQKKPGKKGDPDATLEDGTPRVRMIVIVKEPSHNGKP